MWYRVTFENGAEMSIEAESKEAAADDAIGCLESMTGLPRDRIVSVKIVEVIQIEKEKQKA